MTRRRWWPMATLLAVSLTGTLLCAGDLSPFGGVQAPTLSLAQGFSGGSLLLGGLSPRLRPHALQ